MAEFQEVMKEWVRSRKAINENKLSCCPLEMFSDDYIANIEKEVMAWAAENPEPVYPTWREWLIKLGIVSFEADFCALLDTRPTTLANTVRAYINEEGSKPIPADIAERLGIEPKETNHGT